MEQTLSSVDEQTAQQCVRIGQIISEVNVRLNEGADFEQLLDHVFDSLSEVIPYDRIGIGLLEGNDQTVVLKWMRSNLQGSILTKGYSAPLAGSSLEQILVSGHPRILNDLNAYLKARPDSTSTRHAIQDGIQSSLTFPLKSQGRPFGFVFFSSGQANTYHDVHVKVFSEVTEEISLLIQYGRLSRFFELNKSTKQFLRSALHDLKSPLGVIQGFISILHSESWFQNLDEQSKMVFNILQRNTQHMFDLITDLAEISLINSGIEHIKLRDVVLAGFLDNVVQDAKILAANKDIEFITDIEEDLPQTWVFDHVRIREVVDNLITNAIKYSYPKTTITFFVHTENHKLVMTVNDEGQGIPAEEFPKLFQEFGKTSVRPTAGESSTGLGLAIVKRIVEAHKGKVQVDSKVGRGSRFTFWIPLTNPSNSYPDH